MNIVAREVSGIRELLDHNPVAGERRTGTRRFWTGREEKLLRANYPGGGITACLAALPGRSASSIYQRANVLGLRVPDANGKVNERQAWASSDAIDAIIRRTYQKSPTKNDVQACAGTCGRPRWWISKRAAKLGLVTPRFKQAPWSEAELDLIGDNAHKAPATLRRMLKAKGFDRSETAIIVKLKRLGADRTDPHHLNANQLAGVMGVDRKTVAGWIAKGWLRATRREASATDDFWWIHRRDVARFVIDNVAAVDLRKVDKFWFVDLLAHEGASPYAKSESKRDAILSLAKARPDLNRAQLAAMTESTPSAVSVVLSNARHKQEATT
ncbi:hypothetical protein [Mesorhizobium sp. M6A.T.Ce.TU.016.01.1.1]|uniref:hypothetical protein n=1 Tax=Mesorhizobium sp. M6A.T.Ce.TU.016.01.1.1 TaxID=2496783 RepID=UPI00163BE23C|nr:hypothetical protein [Mesorhizobium sp. M6A.T.Ce.TU.016.01.1.1]